MGTDGVNDDANFWRNALNNSSIALMDLALWSKFDEAYEGLDKSIEALRVVNESFQTGELGLERMTYARNLGRALRIKADLSESDRDRRLNCARAIKAYRVAVRYAEAADNNDERIEALGGLAVTILQSCEHLTMIVARRATARAVYYLEECVKETDDKGSAVTLMQNRVNLAIAKYRLQLISSDDPKTVIKMIALHNELTGLCTEARAKHLGRDSEIFALLSASKVAESISDARNGDQDFLLKAFIAAYTILDEFDLDVESSIYFGCVYQLNHVRDKM